MTVCGRKWEWGEEEALDCVGENMWPDSKPTKLLDHPWEGISIFYDQEILHYEVGHAYWMTQRNGTAVYVNLLLRDTQLPRKKSKNISSRFSEQKKSKLQKGHKRYGRYP